MVTLHAKGGEGGSSKDDGAGFTETWCRCGLPATQPAPLALACRPASGGYVKQTKRWYRGWHYAIRRHRMSLGLQPADLVAGLMPVEMGIVRVRVLLLFAAMGFGPGVHPKLFGYEAVTLLALSFVFDALSLTGLGLIGTFALQIRRMLGWVLLFFVMFQLAQTLNFYSLVTSRRDLDAVREPSERAEEER